MTTRRSFQKGLLGWVGGAALNTAGAAQVQAQPPVPKAARDRSYTLLWNDEFETLSLRSGGPSERGYAFGQGTWAPRYCWRPEDPSGYTLEGEAQFYVDPAFALNKAELPG